MRAARGLPYRPSPHLVDDLWTTQEGKCALCDVRFDRIKRPVVDHDHETGLVRGLLCTNCNLRLGHFEKFVGSTELRDLQYSDFAVRARAYLAASSRRPASKLEEERGPYLAVTRTAA